MYSLKSGTTHGMADTADFIKLLERLPEYLPGEAGDFFVAGGELYVSRAPGRLDLMGGIADYSGSLVLQLTIAAAAHVALQLQDHDEVCIHFAALAYVGKSVAEPRLYFENNVAQGVALLGSSLDAGERRFVFSSTCATYGEPLRVPIDEGHPQQPTKPYGWSKLIMEKILASYDHAYNLKYVALRYFNAAGATAERGEHHEPESHLIPNVLFAAMGKRVFVSVFGGDYPTPDGTAIRDYIHVSDLCSAHLLALEHLRRGGASKLINLGNGHGYSVSEVIETARRITGREIEARLEPARPGDPSRLVANADRSRAVLGWRTQYPELETIIRTAWDWHQAHPDGYEG